MGKFNKITIVLMLICLYKSGVYAQFTPPHVSIQGTLKNANGSVVEDGDYAVTFKLYNSPNSGTSLWSEEATISVAGGIYNHKLGSVNPMNGSNFSSVLFLGVKFGAYELSPRTELTYAPYAFAVQEVACSGAVGDIKYSILNPTQFATVNGTCWVPMDGRAIAGSRLKTIMNVNNVPDGGGLFVRSQEHAAGANNDPDRTSASPIATLQDQAYLAHNHSVNDPGHSHNFQDARHQKNEVYTYAGAGHNSYTVGHFLTQEVGRNTFTSNPTITVSNNTGTETRPKNINFWVYIRIN